VVLSDRLLRCEPGHDADGHREELGQRILAMAKEAEADCLVTGCSMCQSNLDTRQDEIKKDTGRRMISRLLLHRVVGWRWHKDVRNGWGAISSIRSNFLSAKGLL